MSFITNKRGRIAAIITGVVALAASVLTVAPAQAAAATVDIDYVTVNRSTSGDQFVVKSGETVNFYSYYSLSSSYFTDAPISASTEFSFSGPVMTLNGVTANSASYNWSSSGMGDCAYASSSTSTLTVSASCTSYVSVNLSTSYTNSSGSDITVSFDDSAAAVLRAGATTFGVNGSNGSSYASTSDSNGGSFTVGDEDNYINGSFSACLASEKLSTLDEGEELTVDIVLQVDGVDQTLVDDINDPETGIGEVEIRGYESGITSAFTYIVPTGRTTSTEISRDFYSGSPNSGTWTGSMTVKDSDGVTVAGECSGGYVPGAPVTYPTTISAPSSPVSPVLPFTQTTKTIGAGLTALTSATSTDDGSGGKLYAAVVSGSVKVIQITPSGVKSSFAKVGKATIAGVTSVNSLGLYAAKSKWFAISGNPMTGFKIHLGSMSSSTVTTKNVTVAKLTAVCGSGYTGSNVAAQSSAAASPLVNVRCFRSANGGNQSVIAKITTSSSSTASVTKVVALGSAGTAGTAKCISTSLGSNLGATGKVNTFVAYVVTGTGTNPSCMSFSAVSKREIVMITAAGVDSVKTVSGNPWGSSVSDEPYRLYFAPGKTTGAFIGTAMIGGVMSPPTGVRLLTVSSAKTLAVKSTSILYSSDALVDLSFPSIFPVKEISTSKWALRLNNQTGADEMNFGVATVNPSTGAVTVGEMLNVAGYSSYSYAPIMNTTAWSSDGKVRHYVLNSATSVTISTWTTPSS